MRPFTRSLPRIRTRVLPARPMLHAQQEALFNVFKANLTRACWNGPEAGHMLRGSAAEAVGRKAYKSATIYIGGAYRCTHDDEQWWVAAPGFVGG
jgi:hypothetical protein